MPPNGEAFARQLWGPVRTTTSYRPHCTPFTLPSGGIINVNQTAALTLTENAQFNPQCSAGATGVLTDASQNSTVVDFRDPFYASVAPQFFAIAIATVVAYLLVIIIFITPGTSFGSGSGGSAGVLGRRGIGVSYGSGSVVVIGRRPWLQKAAAITVLISLTIASTDTFKFAERQYNSGYSDAAALVDDVNASVEIRVVSVISDTFVWLAQVQTLIRLFPRHKEKVTIKWLGFALILFDTIFDILNNFVYQSIKSRPRRFQDAIPALSYLFELAIGLIYASCVIYYSLSKRRFAFWHSKMKNICLVAFLSLMSVLIPVVFFVLDVSKPDVAGWGGYIRWVGAAAASVVVWEWVERIEALERDERKDGILGREIFDGDEMLDMIPSEEVVWPSRGPNRHDGDGGVAGNASGRTNGDGHGHRPIRSRVPFQNRHADDARARSPQTIATAARAPPIRLDQRNPALPPQAVTPISRTDTSSASTIYAVRRLTLNSPSPRVPEDPDYAALVVPKKTSSAESSSSVPEVIHTDLAAVNIGMAERIVPSSHPKQNVPPLWRAVPNPFKRRRAAPPVEVAGAQLSAERAQDRSAAGQGRHPTIRSRVDAFATSQKRKFRAHAQGEPEEPPQSITIIPAQRRGQRTWSPHDLADSVTEEVDHPNVHEQSQDANQNVPQPPSSNAEAPVTIIPAPVRGQRTWSPQDLVYPTLEPTSQRQSSNDSQEEQFSSLEGPQASSEQTDTSPINGSNQSRTLLSRRGTLMISEYEGRNSTGPYRRSLYSRAAGPPARPGSTPVGPPEEAVAGGQYEIAKQEQSSVRNATTAPSSRSEVGPPKESPRNDPAG